MSLRSHASSFIPGLHTCFGHRTMATARTAGQITSVSGTKRGPTRPGYLRIASVGSPSFPTRTALTSDRERSRRPMRVAVIGAGQMGSIYAAAALRNGHDVHFIDANQN